MTEKPVDAFVSAAPRDIPPVTLRPYRPEDCPALLSVFYRAVHEAEPGHAAGTRTAAPSGTPGRRSWLGGRPPNGNPPGRPPWLPIRRWWRRKAKQAPPSALPTWT